MPEITHLEINPPEKPPNSNPPEMNPPVDVHTPEKTHLSVLVKWLARKTLKNLSVYSIVSLFFYAAIVIDCQKRPSVS